MIVRHPISPDVIRGLPKPGAVQNGTRSRITSGIVGRVI